MPWTATRPDNRRKVWPALNCYAWSFPRSALLNLRLRPTPEDAWPLGGLEERRVLSNGRMGGLLAPADSRGHDRISRRPPGLRRPARGPCLSLSRHAVLSFSRVHWR